MSIIATWGSKTFEVSDKIINTFHGFSASRQLASNEQRNDGGEPSTNVKGADLRELSFQISLHSSLGVSAQSEIDSWDALVEKGDAYPFDIGGTPWGGGVKFQLKSWSLSDAVFGKKQGGFFVITQCVLSLTFKEWQPQAKKAAGTKKKGKKAAAKKNNGMVVAAENTYSKDYKQNIKGDTSLAK